MSWHSVALVAAGGAAGCVLRHLIGTATGGPDATFPWVTLAINVVGSFLLGLVVGSTPPDHAGRLLFGTGFCGGFTTFSSLSVELLTLMQRGAHGRAVAYVAASVLLGLLAACSGATFGRGIATQR